jgi:hypothetical protein
MTNPSEESLRAGASHVDEAEQMASGLSNPRQSTHEEIESLTSETSLADLTLSMFSQGSSIRVRVGNSHNSSELYESSYDSADAANSAMLEAGILTNDQVPDSSKPAGTGIPVSGITVEQLLASGLKRHGTSTL